MTCYQHYRHWLMHLSYQYMSVKIPPRRASPLTSCSLLYNSNNSNICVKLLKFHTNNACFWNSPPAQYFLVNFDCQKINCNIRSYLLSSWLLFYCFLRMPYSIFVRVTSVQIWCITVMSWLELPNSLFPASTEFKSFYAGMNYFSPYNSLSYRRNVASRLLLSIAMSNVHTSCIL